MIHKNVIVWEIACARMMVISRRACTPCYSLTPRDTCLHLTTTSSNVVVQVFPDASRDDGRARSFRIFTPRRAIRKTKREGDSTDLSNRRLGFIRVKRDEECRCYREDAICDHSNLPSTLPD